LNINVLTLQHLLKKFAVCMANDIREVQIWLPLHGKKRSGCCNIDENRIEQCFAAHIVHSCQQYWTVLLQDWTILLHPIQAQQYCSILLTSVNNVGSKTLFNPVEQRARRFLPCTVTVTCQWLHQHHIFVWYVWLPLISCTRGMTTTGIKQN
jgi:hypothetical protein